jgi:putative membrane protein
VTHTGHAAPFEPLPWLVPLVVLAVGSGAYLAGVRALRSRRSRHGRPWSRWRTASWLTGVALVAAALTPVVAQVPPGAREHMVQHLLLGMLGPLGLVMGAPVTLLLGATPTPVGRAVAGVLRSRPLHVLGHPVTAALLHVGGLFALYLTPVYATAARHEAVHLLVHVHFLVAGCLFTWAVAGPDPAPRRPGVGVRAAVLVVAGGAHSYLGKLLYARAGELPPGAGHSAAEVEVAARWMYYGGDVVELLLAAALFAAWYRGAGRAARPPRPVRRRTAAWSRSRGRGAAAS